MGCLWLLNSLGPPHTTTSTTTTPLELYHLLATINKGPFTDIIDISWCRPKNNTMCSSSSAKKEVCILLREWCILGSYGDPLSETESYAVITNYGIWLKYIEYAVNANSIMLSNCGDWTTWLSGRNGCTCRVFWVIGNASHIILY